MAPSIELYHNFEYNPRYAHYYLNFFNADLQIYNQLTKWLFSQIQNLTFNDIYFIKNHHSIIPYITNYSNINLINIDHHHDIKYDNNDNLNCGNWVFYAYQNNIINNYTWINNKNSINPICKDWIPYNNINIQTFNLDQIQADKIIICLSPEWVPEQFHPLFLTWMDLCGIYFNNKYILN